MEKLNVNVGAVFTQVMFCDDHGQLHHHRVMTDVDKPWKSVIKVLALLKEGMSMDMPKTWNNLFQSVNILLQYKQINYTSLLESLREELAYYLSEGCQITIQTTDDMDKLEEIEYQQAQQLMELAEETPQEVLADMDQALAAKRRELPLPMFYRQDEFSIDLRHTDTYGFIGETFRMKRSVDLDMIVDEYQSLWKVSNYGRGSPKMMRSLYEFEGGVLMSGFFNDG